MTKDEIKIFDVLLGDFKEFTTFALKILEGRHYELSPHQIFLCETLQKVISRKITRLIINIPPAYAKTSIVVWAFISYIYALNNQSKCLHISYSDEIVKDNSSKIKTIINSEEYQYYFRDVDFKEDTKSKGLWATSAGGAFKASASGSAITGFRAGYFNDDKLISGVMIIDDPTKPDDAFSGSKMQAVNQRWESTFRSRPAHDNVPVIVIMQRISDDDFTDHLLNNSDEQWHHLVLPAYIEEDYTYTQNGIYIDHNLPIGTLWDLKADDKKAKVLMNDIQYSQDPTPEKGEMVEKEWFRMYDTLPKIKEFTIYCDTASKIKKYNDYSVFGLFGKCYGNNGYLVKMYRGKVKVPQLKTTFLHFYKEALKITGQSKIRVSIEDKDSGVGLIQALQDETDIYIKAIQRKEGKYARLLRATTKIKDEIMHLKRNDDITGVVVSEFVRFKADDSHKHDDTVDVVVDFINNEIPEKTTANSFKVEI